MRKEILDKLSVVTEEERSILGGSPGIDREIYMQGESNKINAQKLLDRGELITMRAGTRFVHFPPHTHDYIEMVYMCQGESTHVVNGHTVRLLCGEVLILNQNAVQEILPLSAGDVLVNFIILPQFFNRALEMTDAEETPLRRFILDCIFGKENPNAYLHLKVSNILEIQNLFENLVFSFVEKKSGKQKINEYLLGILLLEFISNAKTLDFETAEKSAVLEALHYIETNYNGGSLAEFAKQSHYDFHWISRELKRKTGKTFTELLREKRLLQAAFLLRTTKMRVSDIAAAVGYSNLSFFYKTFDQHFQHLPKAYRDKQNKRKTGQ